MKAFESVPHGALAFGKTASQSPTCEMDSLLPPRQDAADHRVDKWSNPLSGVPQGAAAIPETHRQDLIHQTVT